MMRIKYDNEIKSIGSQLDKCQKELQSQVELTKSKNQLQQIN